MYRTELRIGQVLWAVTAVFMFWLVAAGTASAQLRGGGDDDVEYDVKASSGTLDNNHQEFPLNYTVEYDDGEQEDILLDPAEDIERCRADGTSEECLNTGIKRRLTTRAGRVPVAIWWFGIRYPIGDDILCFPDQYGGCWCLCLKWLEISWWPWQIRPIYIWYYDPCCR